MRVPVREAVRAGGAQGSGLPRPQPAGGRQGRLPEGNKNKFNIFHETFYSFFLIQVFKFNHMKLFFLISKYKNITDFLNIM